MPCSRSHTLSVLSLDPETARHPSRIESLADRILTVDAQCAGARPEALRRGFHVVAYRDRPDLPGCLGDAARGCRRIFGQAGVLNYWTCAPVSSR